MRALAMKVEDRFENVAQMADALLQLGPATIKTINKGTGSVQGKARKAEKHLKREKAEQVGHDTASSVVLEKDDSDKTVTVLKETKDRVRSGLATMNGDTASNVSEKVDRDEPEEVKGEPSDDADAITISVAPIQTQLARWYMSDVKSREETNGKTAQEETAEEQRLEEIARQETSFIHKVEGNGPNIEQQGTLDIEEELVEAPTLEPLPEPIPRPLQTAATHDNAKQEAHILRNLRDRITGALPMLPRMSQPRIPSIPSAGIDTTAKDDNKSLLKRLQSFILGEQHHSTTAAALIETPLRIQPNQSYSLRIHLMGRDAPMLPAGTKKGTPPAGLSALAYGESVHIEVRSALFQNYAYIVQRADVQIPARGYAAEVSIPMQALATGRSGRRERLHIFFTDEQRKPLYEKPFVIELFISHLVQTGREGHNVLSLPL